MNRKRIAIWAVAFALAGGAAISYSLLNPPTKTGPHFETAAVDRGPIVAKVTASGTLSALVAVQVGSQVSGREKEILVDFNAPVTRGQVVARIDPQLFQAALVQAKFNLAAARAELLEALGRPWLVGSTDPGLHGRTICAVLNASSQELHKPMRTIALRENVSSERVRCRVEMILALGLLARAGVLWEET